MVDLKIGAVAALVMSLAVGGPSATDSGAADSASTRGVTSPSSSNQILNLYDAFGPEDPGTVQDFGFSALVHYRGKTILFDAGTNAAILEKNARALGVDLRDVDIAVASHSHFDHISGFDYLLDVNPGVKIYFPADPFWGAPMPFDATGMDPAAKDELPLDQQYFRGDKTKFTFRSSGRFWKANVEFVSGHTEIAPGITLIATRSPFLGYFTGYPNVGIAGEADAGAQKTLGLPELSMSLTTEAGEVLIVGCSHSMVDVIARTTKEHLDRDIDMIYGGYHLLPYGAEEITVVGKRLRDELGVTRVAPAHCTGHLGFKTLRQLFQGRYLLAGLGSRVELAP